jgi:surfactin synthase thioesterase subunit
MCCIPFISLGHDFGALVAFELAMEMKKRKMRSPFHLFVSSRHAPSFQLQERESTFNDQMLVERLKKYGGTPPEVLENEDLLQLILPVIRCDLGMSTSSRSSNARFTAAISDESSFIEGRAPLDCDITVLRGQHEHPSVTDESIDLWSKCTSFEFHKTTFEGDHFFLFQNNLLIPLISHLNSEMRKSLTEFQERVEDGRDTIFGQILRKEKPATFVYEDDMCVAFKDVNPVAPFHVLIGEVISPSCWFNRHQVPREKISRLSRAKPSHQMLLGSVLVPEL